MLSLSPSWFRSVILFCLSILSYSDIIAQPARKTDALPDTLTIAIFHSNDVNGEIVRQRSPDGYIGGMAPRIHLIRQAQPSGTVLAFDAGNALGPAPLSAWDQGTTMVDLMRLAGYEALLPANHEFDYGLETLKRRRDRGGFPFLGTNLSVDDGGSAFSRSLLIETPGPRIGVIGLLSGEAATLTNPEHFDSVEITDPRKAAGPEIESLQRRGADYIIALTHMQEEETLRFAREVEGVHLVIAGGYRHLNDADMTLGLIRLGNGTQIVTTPESGLFLGRIDVRFVGNAGNGYVPVHSAADLKRIDYTVPDDLEAAALIARAIDRYSTAARDTIGVITGDSHANQAGMIARLMKTYTDAEVGILNLGLIRPVLTDRPLIRRDINGFIRYPNTIQLVELTGRQLRSIIAISKRTERENARLAFAGLDQNAFMIEGRALRDAEKYRIATTDFLANGGDGYTVFTESPVRIDVGKPLRSLLQETMQAGGRLTSGSFQQDGHRGIWHSGLQLEGAFERNYVDETTAVYRSRNERVPFLSGATTVAWNSAIRYFLERGDGAHVTRYENRMEFSQIGKSFDDLTPSTDQIQMELRYRYRTFGKHGDPFISTGLNTAFTRATGQRPLQTVSTVGFEYRPASGLIARVAGRSQRDFVLNKTDLGGEVTLEWTRLLKSKASLNSRVRSFFGFTNRRVISVENYNTISFPLLGDLRLNVRQNNFLYRVNRIGGVEANGIAFRSIVTVGFAYGLNWKWL